MASDAVREDLVVQAREELGKGQRRVRTAKPSGRIEEDPPRKLPSGFAEPEADDERAGDDDAAAGSDGDSGTSGAPKKRRRRRRKPGGEGAARPVDAAPE